jgi:predicted ATPase/transcriptional regulator with XRE-family HTH domain
MRSDAEPAGETRSPFGELLREFRLAANLSQETLAEQAGVSVSGISALERGTRRAPHRDTIALLASALKLTSADRSRLQDAATRISTPRQRGVPATGEGRAARHHLPLSLTTFHGRTQELRALADAISAYRLVTLIGTGGIGKTRLALETARTIAERFPDGVWCVELAPVSDPSFVGQRVASTLGIAVRTATSESNNAWIEQLAGKQLLIVLDNCEHLLDAAAAVTQQILERCQNVRVLATSREALRIGAEYVVRVDPLAVPAAAADRPATLAEVRASPAATLFLDRARHVAPALKLSDGAAACQTLADICTRLDGMPLAIELAAARMNALTPAALLRSLDVRFHVLTTGSRTALPRHQTLRALIDWSHDLLNEPERRVFRRLGIFAGGWTLEAAQTICTDDAVTANDLLVILSSLVDKSLVVARPTSNSIRYQMLETTRAYVSDGGERDSTARRHAECFRVLLRRNNALWGTLPMAAWLVPLKCELDNLRAALGWTIGEGRDVLLGVAITVAQYMALQPLSLGQEGFQWCERALAALGKDTSPAFEAPLTFVLAKLYTDEGYVGRSLEPAMRAVELYRRLEEPSTLRELTTRECLAYALAYAGCALWTLGRCQEADRAASEALALAGTDLARPQPHVGVYIWALVVKSLSITDIKSRRALLEQALTRSRAFPSGYVFEGLALIGLALAEFDAGDVERAEHYAADAADYYRSIGLYVNNRCWALCIVSICASLLEDHDAAIGYAREGLITFGKARPMNVASLMLVVANALVKQGHARDAARIIGAWEACTVAQFRSGDAQALCHRTVAQLRKDSGNLELEAWLAEGRGWTLDEAIAAALEFDQRSQPMASTSYG